MTDLLTRIESASAGSREISDEVLLALGWERRIGELGPAKLDQWFSPNGDGVDYGPFRPDVSESVDDCLRLMPEGCDWWHLTSSSTACLSFNGDAFHGEGKHPALAFSAALVRAHTAGGEG